jgi:hypothetical protein
MSLLRPPKRLHVVKMMFDDEQMLDLQRVAAAKQRSLADLCRVEVLNAMYGILGRAERRRQRNESPSQVLIVPDLDPQDFQESAFDGDGMVG